MSLEIRSYEFHPLDQDGNDSSCPDCYNGQHFPEQIVGGVVFREELSELEARDAGAAVCIRCRGTGYLPGTTGGKWLQKTSEEENRRALEYLEYEIRVARKRLKARAIERIRLLSLLKAYEAVPVPSAWDRVRKPPV
jgi:hypothetical protein